jgi:hypothetical protein
LPAENGRVLKREVAFMAITANGKITKGPATHCLVDALKYAFDKDNPHLVEFTISDVGRVKLQIIALSHEDGSGANFLFSGYVKSIPVLGIEIYCLSDCDKKVHGYYNSRSQIGWVRPGWDTLFLTH